MCGDSGSLFILKLWLRNYYFSPNNKMLAEWDLPAPVAGAIFINDKILLTCEGISKWLPGQQLTQHKWLDALSPVCYVTEMCYRRFVYPLSEVPNCIIVWSYRTAMGKPTFWHEVARNFQTTSRHVISYVFLYIHERKSLGPREDRSSPYKDGAECQLQWSSRRKR